MASVSGSTDELLRLHLRFAFHDVFIKLIVGVVFLPGNVIILHCVDKETIALLHIRLLLLQSAILFSKPAFEMSCTRITREVNWSLIVNLIWLMLPIVSFCSIVLCYIWINWLPMPPERLVHDYQLSVIIIGVSCVIQVLTEPVFIFSQEFLYFELEKNAVYLALAIRTFLQLTAAIFFPEYTGRATACGELLSSIACLVLYWGVIYLELKKKRKLIENGQLQRSNPLANLPFCSLSEFLPGNVFSSQPYLDAEIARETLQSFKQLMIEQFVSSGEQYLMVGSSTITLAEQGTFDAVSCMDLVPECSILRPVRNECYRYFAHKIVRNNPLREHAPERVNEISDALYKFARVFGLLGYGMFTFGFSYSHLIAAIYGGNTLTDEPGPLLLKMQCVKILLQAINGVTESYSFATMSANYFKRYHKSLDLLWFCCLVMCGILSNSLGSVVLMVAKLCYSGVRIVHSRPFIVINDFSLMLRFIYFLWLIHKQFGGVPSPLFGLLPTWRETLAFGAAALITCFSERYIYPYSITLHVVCGVLSAIHVIEAILFTERLSWSQLLVLIRQVIRYGA